MISEIIHKKKFKFLDSFFRLERPNRLPRFLPLSLGSKFYYSGRTELQAVQESKQRGKISKIFTRSPSKRILTNCAAKQNGSDSNGKSTILSLTKSYRSHDNKIQSKQSDALPRKAWESQSDEYGRMFVNGNFQAKINFSLLLFQ